MTILNQLWVLVTEMLFARDTTDREPVSTVRSEKTKMERATRRARLLTWKSKKVARMRCFFRRQNPGVCGRAGYVQFRAGRKRRKSWPAEPHRYFQGAGWKSYADLLGQPCARHEIPCARHKILPFAEAREIARALGVRSANEWRRIVTSHKRPTGLPANPDRTYNGKGWDGFADFFGYAPVRRPRCNRHANTLAYGVPEMASTIWPKTASTGAVQ